MPAPGEQPTEADATTAERPLPRFPEPDTAGFWRGTAAGRLTYQLCDECARVVFYPRAVCPWCGGRTLRMHVSAGLGTVYSATLIRRAGHPFFLRRVPYFLAYIDLDEGFRMLSEVIDAAGHTASSLVGTRVEVTWEEHPEVSIPLFRPVAT
jgi:uncharacterized protein